jgi:hypothetical protein
MAQAAMISERSKSRPKNSERRGGSRVQARASASPRGEEGRRGELVVVVVGGQKAVKDCVVSAPGDRRITRL